MSEDRFAWKDGRRRRVSRRHRSERSSSEELEEFDWGGLVVLAERAVDALSDRRLIPVQTMLDGDDPRNSPIVAMVLLTLDKDRMPSEEGLRDFLMRAADETLSYE